jgi:PAS domain S-box-containing protein
VETDPRASAARGEALERAEERARELARKRGARSRTSDPERTAEVESGLPSPRAAEHLSAYLEAAIDCVIVADASGRIVEFNPASERTFGYSREEALGRTMAELIVPPSLRERHIAAFARFVDTREGSMLGRRVELTGMRADGSEFPVELALSQVEAEPVLICGALRDISATKQAESHLRELAEEQAALRQIATLVAYESSAEPLVAVVVEQVARVFHVPLVRLIRYEPTAAVVVGGFSESDDEPFPIGSRWQLDTPGLLATIRRIGRAARVEDYAQAPGDGAGAVRAAGMRSAVGSPIVVGGRVWGAIVLLSPRSASLPEDTAARLADFTDLVATALANAESRAALSQLADEQAALRRVATMVAQESPPAEPFAEIARAPASEQLFSTVAREVASVLNVPGVIVTSYDADGTALTLGHAFRPDLAGAEQFLGIGTRMPRDPGSLAAQVFDTHGPARVDDFSTLPGSVGDLARAALVGSGCAAPIVVNGAVWGKMCVFSRVGTTLSAGTENRLHHFVELLATAIANHEARADLAASEARARELAEEQAALRRVATLVAKEAKSEAVFSAVAHEVAHVFGVQHVTVCRYESDAIVILSSFEAAEPAAASPPFPAGRRLPLDVPSLPAWVHRTGKPARIDDFTASDGLYAVARQAGLTAAVGVPIVVGGSVWGSINIASTKKYRFSQDAEQRLARFTELIATSVSNATMREELAASRARVIAAADDARQRIERDLHDGAQQQLVTLAVALRRTAAKIPAGSDELRADLSRVADGLTTACEELREMSRGIHPAVLTEGGLAPALKALGRRSAVRVKLDVRLEDRLPDRVEVAAYYAVSEALTNASKHANASRVWVSLGTEDDTLHLAIRDDGVGGADPSRGSGLTGLRDRIEALGGTIALDSPPGSGTTIGVQIPTRGSGDEGQSSSEVIAREPPQSGR